MNSFLDLAFTLITRPREALSVMTNEEKLKEGFVLWVFVIFVTTLSAMQGSGDLLSQFLALVLFMGLGLLLHSAVIDYISGLWGGMGTARGITAGFMASSLPAAFSVFFTLLNAMGLSALSGIGGFVVFCWMFYLDVVAISENYRFRFGKSFLIALSPYLILVLFFILLVLVAVVAAVAGFADMAAIEEVGGAIESL